MSDEEAVKVAYLNAGVVRLNKGMCYVASEGAKESKMNPGDRLSRQFYIEAEAWEDANLKLRIRTLETELLQLQQMMSSMADRVSCLMSKQVEIL